MANTDLWNKLKDPPSNALSRIEGGRLKDMLDIKPQWRYQAMTEAFGPCGQGWKFEIAERWCEERGTEVLCFVVVNLYTKIKEDYWSEPIPGIGGSKVLEQEKTGLHPSDEGYKMALTDALSVAMKMLGVAAEVYLGNKGSTDSRYGNRGNAQPPAEGKEKGSGRVDATNITDKVEDGKLKWRRFEITMGGITYSTFDPKLGAAAVELEGKTVEYTAKKKGRYWTLESIEPVIQMREDEQHPPRPPVITDDLDPAQHDDLPF